MRKILEEITVFFGVFSLLFVLSFSFPFQLFPDVGAWFEPMFNKLVQLDAKVIHLEIAPYHSGEDSIGMMYNTLNIVLISLLAYIILRSIVSKRKVEVHSVIIVWFRYYLAIILLIYGFDKVYKWQFYSPESNIMYTRVKDLSQDLLYWTTMGTSYSYSLFGGILEVIAGVLLLFRKTYIIGALLGFAILANVFAVNIGFDVTVKLFSGFLLLISVLLLLPYALLLIRFLTGNREQIVVPEPNYSKRKWYLPVKVLVLLLMLMESQYKYVAAGNFNDDLAPRPHFNGVYKVLQGKERKIVRIHFHRQGYFILEMIDGQFIDYQLTVNELQKEFVLLDYNLDQVKIDYEEHGDTLIMNGKDGTFSLITVKQEL